MDEPMKLFDWSDEKNQALKTECGITFEEILYHLIHDDLIDTIEQPSKEKYPGRRIFIVNVEGHVFLVPFVEDSKSIFLKTIIPSRKLTKQYLGEELK
jgi:hypothetical protein